MICPLPVFYFPGCAFLSFSLYFLQIAQTPCSTTPIWDSTYSSRVKTILPGADGFSLIFCQVTSTCDLSPLVNQFWNSPLDLSFSMSSLPYFLKDLSGALSWSMRKTKVVILLYLLSGGVWKHRSCRTSSYLVINRLRVLTYGLTSISFGSRILSQGHILHRNLWVASRSILSPWMLKIADYYHRFRTYLLPCVLQSPSLLLYDRRPYADKCNSHLSIGNLRQAEHIRTSVVFRFFSIPCLPASCWRHASPNPSIPVTLFCL